MNEFHPLKCEQIFIEALPFLFFFLIIPSGLQQMSKGDTLHQHCLEEYTARINIYNIVSYSRDLNAHLIS
jgi:hypothetical protein